MGDIFVEAAEFVALTRDAKAVAFEAQLFVESPREPSGRRRWGFIGPKHLLIGIKVDLVVGSGEIVDADGNLVYVMDFLVNRLELPFVQLLGRFFVNRTRGSSSSLSLLN